MGKLLLFVIAELDVLLADAEREQEVLAVVLPVCKPLKVGAGLTEKFQLHLLKLAGTEGKVTGRNLVAEGLSDLADAKGNLLSGGTLHVFKVDKDTLRGFRAEEDFVLTVLGNALEGFKHQVKLSDVGKVMLAAVGTGNLMFFDIV